MKFTVAALAITALLLPLSGSAAGETDGVDASRERVRTCGLTPGDGAYSYIRTVGIRCRPAWRVVRRAHRKFCDRHNDCMISESNIGMRYRGRVGYNGWGCHVVDGWEYLRVRCAKGQMRALWESAS